jgi:hypothetical protein
MASSPTDRASDLGRSRTPPIKGGALLHKIAASYDSALAALAQSDLELVQSLMNEVGAMTRELGNPGDMAQDAAALQAVNDSHGKLLAALHTMRDATQATIQQAQQGRRALHGYGNRSVNTTGTRLESLS